MTPENFGNLGVTLIEETLVRKGPEKNDDWIVIEGYPENMILGLNIRERDDTFVEELAKSIVSQGQLQECVGDTLQDGAVRVWAGQHRYWAVELLNESIKQYNEESPGEQEERYKLRVRIRQREMTDTEVLEVQITENMHKDMRPEEEAAAIKSVFDFYKKVVGDEATVADFSRRVGLGESKVGNAIKYTGTDERVRELVESDSLLYSVATEVSRLPKDKQFEVAMKIILYNFSREGARTFIRNTLEEDERPSLFQGEMVEAFEKDNYRLAFRTAADRAAKDAAGYFRRVIMLMERVEDTEKITMTDTIRDILSEFVYSASYFRLQLEKEAPHLLEKLHHRVFQSIGNRNLDQ
jgi:hypothetical protein